MENLKKQYELMTKFDFARSFYKKAIVSEYDNYIILKSYDTIVCIIDLLNLKAYIKNIYSSTTLRHIKEFLQQNNFVCENKKEIVKDFTNIKKFDEILKILNIA